jgi:glycogen operon protein
VKLIAEPWDASMDGYRVGEFPPPWVEWNDQYRDTMRDFWRGHTSGVRTVATRLAGSSDLYADDGRSPYASVNFVTAHDGFTLHDLVSYNDKHNEANGEDNRDGSDNNLSWNHGIEGHTPTGDDATTEPWQVIVPPRRRSQRNLLATLLLAAGTPMLTAGDEFGRSQGGNNNAYVQDNKVSWLRWAMDDAATDLLETTRYLLRLRREHPALRADSFYLGSPRPHESDPDLLWYDRTGAPMEPATWNQPGRRVLQMLRPGPTPGDADVLLVINGGLSDTEVTLAPRAAPGDGPDGGRGDAPWELVWDSTWDFPAVPGDEAGPRTSGTLDALSVQVLLSPGI